MSAAKDVKIQLFHIASRVVAPIVAAAASKITVAIDPTVQDAQLRQLNLFAFEEMEVHYNALKLAFEDNTANEWPDPVVPAAAAAVNPVTAPVSPSVPPAASIPSPGSNLSSIVSAVAQGAAAVAPVIAAIH